MLSQCLWRHVCTSPAVCGTCCFLGITHHLRLLKSVYFFPHESLNLEERSLIKVSNLGPRAPVSHCLHSVRLWNFILITIFPYSFFRVDLLLLRKPCITDTVNISKTSIIFSCCLYSRTITRGRYRPSGELKAKMGMQLSSIKKLKRDDRFERNQLWMSL